MSRLIVIVGLANGKPTAAAEPVYVGRSGAEAEAAMQAPEHRKFEFFEIFRNLPSIRKHNRNHQPETVAEPKPKPRK